MSWLIAAALFWLTVTLYSAIRRLILRALAHSLALVIAVLQFAHWLTGLIANRHANTHRNSSARCA